MARKSETERLQTIEEKIEQLKAQKQKIKSMADQKERKARTRRIIQVGGTFERWWDVRTHEEADAVVRLLEEKGVQPDQVKNFLRKARGDQQQVTS